MNHGLRATAQMTATHPRSRDRWIVGAALAVLIVPVVTDLVLSGTRRVFAYLAADAFYYLQVARQWGEHGRISFDGERSTNGFHPLWQAILAVLDGVGLRGTALMLVVVLLGAGLTALAVLLLARSMVAAHGALPALFVLLPLGVYGVLLGPVWALVDQTSPSQTSIYQGPLPLYGTLWSAANGMETGAVLATFALMAWLLVKGRSTWLVGAAMAALVLARLDLGLIVAGLLATQGALAWRRHDRRAGRAVLASGAVVAMVVAAYLAWNLAYAGAALPLSGTLKSTFPRPDLGNALGVRDVLTGEHSYLLLRLYRQAPIILSAVAALAWLVGAARRPRDVDTADARARWHETLSGVAVGVLALDGYDFFFVPLTSQGHWYFPIQILLITLVVLEWLARRPLLDRPFIAVVAVALSAITFAGVGRTTDYHERFAAFYERAGAVRAFYGENPPKLLAVDDGIDAYSLGFPAMSGLGLMLDEDAVDAFVDGQLVSLAFERGFDRISSVAYADGMGLTAASPPPEVRAWVADLLPDQDLRGFDFAVEYASAPFATPRPGGDGRYLIVRVTRAGRLRG